MKIAILNRNPGMFPGGDILSLMDLSSALEKVYGFQVDLHHHEKKNLDAYDLLIIKHVNFAWSADNYDWALRFNKPYILQPMFYPGDWGHGNKGIKEMVEDAAAIVPYAPSEWDDLKAAVGCEHPNVQFIPNGVGDSFIIDELDLDREGYVLSTSARTGKGEDKVEKACNNLSIPFYFVTDKEFLEMPSYYREARVFVNANDSERMSRTIHEGLASGCRVVATERNHGNYWYEQLLTCDPDNAEKLTESIKFAWEEKHWNWMPNICARVWTWEKVAEEWANLIRSI